MDTHDSITCPDCLNYTCNIGAAEASSYVDKWAPCVHFVRGFPGGEATMTTVEFAEMHPKFRVTSLDAAKFLIEEVIVQQELARALAHEADGAEMIVAYMPHFDGETACATIWCCTVAQFRTNRGLLGFDRPVRFLLREQNDGTYYLVVDPRGRMSPRAYQGLGFYDTAGLLSLGLR